MTAFDPNDLSRNEEFKEKAYRLIVKNLQRCGVAELKVPTIAEKLMRHVDFLERISIESIFFDFDGKVGETARLLGLPKARFVAAAEKHHSLFYYSPEAINGNVTCSAELLGLTKTRFVAAAEKQPPLFYQFPETINANITRSAELLGIPKARYVAAAEKSPPLFYQSPETIDDKVIRSAELLGIPKARYVAAAEKSPPLFYQSPETIDGNVTRSAELLGISKARFTVAAEKQPSLFCRLPETIAKHGELMKRFGNKGIVRPPQDWGDVYEAQPILLTFANDNFYLRHIWARANGMKEEALGKIFKTSRGVVEREVVAHYGHNADEKIITRPSPTGKDITHEERKHRALVAMVQAGVIKSYKYQPV